VKPDVELSPLNALYVHKALISLAFQLLAVFVPVEVLRQGAPLSTALLFPLVAFLVRALLAWPGSAAVSRLGYRRSMAAAYFLFLPAFLALRSFDLAAPTVAAAAVLIGTGESLHDIAIRSDFADLTSDQDPDSASARLHSIPKVSSVIGPALGGLLLSFYGFGPLVVVAAALLLVAALPLLRIGRNRPDSFSFVSFATGRAKSEEDIFLQRGIILCAGVYIFPIFVFKFVAGELEVGGVRSLGALASVAFGFAVERVVSRYGRKKVISAGALASALFMFLKPHLFSTVSVFAASFAGGLALSTYFIPLYSWMADKGRGQVPEYFGYRQVLVSTGGVMLSGTAILLLEALPELTVLRYSMYAAGIASLFVALVGWREVSD
jgi:Major Facilitator Superfamily.